MAFPNVRPNPFPFLCLSLHRCRRARSFSASLVVISFALGVGQNRAEPFLEDLLSVGFAFAESDGDKPAPLRGDGKAADAAEEVKMGKHGWSFWLTSHPPSPCAFDSPPSIAPHIPPPPRGHPRRAR